MGSEVKVKAGIVGGAGYTGGELLRLLLHHPNVAIAFVHSNSQAGKPVYAVHQDLLGDTELTFTNVLQPDVDVLFLCVGHGEARRFEETNSIPQHVKLIDLSQDFRWNETTTEASVTAAGRTFIYGLPELQREAIREAQNIANPGCFATAIQLALLPLAAEGLLTEELHVSGITGSTGAGQSLSPTSHYSWRSSNISNYKVLHHQHLREIGRSLHHLQDHEIRGINFVPYRGPFTRGILCTSYMRSSLSQTDATALYKAYYAPHPFVTISAATPDLKQVVNTNKCLLYIEQQGEHLVVTSMIDNLVKGASGQAVQNMNLMFGLDERAGLHLKASAF